jgi:hypothetical protein
VWLGTFIGQPLVYSFEKRGEGCGAVSQGCVVVTDAATFWMGRNGFWAYNGYTNPLPCDIQEGVFGNINTLQLSKVTAFHNSAFGEVTWFYCSANSTEIDSYATFNYRENHWTPGSLVRLAGADRGVFTYPMMVGDDGYVYDHENGYARGGTAAYAKTGPIEYGNAGQNLFSIEQMVPDAQALGPVSISFDGRMYPLRAPDTYGPYSLTDLTDVRLTARSIEMKFSVASGQDGKIGSFRLDVKQRGKR